jgi:YD repeat-containing protein
MKKSLPLLMAPLLMGALLFLPGCKKLFDYLQDHPDTAPGYCRIEQLNYALPPGESFSRDTITFTYNAMGNPTTATRPGPRTGATDFVFLYDKHDRLTDVAGVFHLADLYDSTYGETWDHYIFDAHNRVVIDSSYLFPFIENGHPTLDNHGSLILFTYDYDSEDRVIAVHETIGGRLLTFTYAYGPDGNLTGVAHDHEVNIHQTNKIWMFLDKDYSKNNPLPDTYTYNSFGLPVKIAPPGNGGNFFMYGFTEADIRYSCK